MREMKEKMDLTWNDLLDKDPGRTEEDFQGSEKLPRSAGMGRRSSLKIKKLA